LQTFYCGVKSKVGLYTLFPRFIVGVWMAFQAKRTDATESQQVQVLTQSVAKSPQIVYVQQQVQNTCDPQTARRVEQAVHTMVTSKDQTQKNEAARTIADGMRRAGFDKPAISEHVNFLDKSGNSLRYLTEHGELEKAQRLSDRIRDGTINTSDQVLQQMQNWGYRDFVVQEQNNLNQYDSFISIIAAGIMTIAAAGAQKLLQSMQASQDEMERARLKKELEKELEKLNISPEKIEAVADKAEQKLKNGQSIDYVMADIIAAKDAWAMEPATMLPATYNFVGSKSIVVNTS